MGVLATFIWLKGYGKQKGYRNVFRGVEYTINLVPKLKLELVVKDEHVEAVLEAIRAVACTGQFGDGKIFIPRSKTGCE